MQEQKKYHQRKLAIIEMIEECEECIKNAESFLHELNQSNAFFKGLQLKNAQNNIARYTRIKNYLTERYNR